MTQSTLMTINVRVAAAREFHYIDNIFRLRKNVQPSESYVEGNALVTPGVKGQHWAALRPRKKVTRKNAFFFFSW